MAQTLREHIQMLLDLSLECPEALDLPVYQQSAMDQPYTYDPGHVYVGTVYTAVFDDEDTNFYTFRESAEDEDPEDIREFPAVVVEAI